MKSIKIRNVYAEKNIIKTLKRQIIGCEKIFGYHLSYKRICVLDMETCNSAIKRQIIKMDK